MKPVVYVLPIALVLAACGASPRPAAPGRLAVASRAAGGERDTTSIRAIKKEIKRFFEVATLDKVVMVKTLAIVPAPAWNEFLYEAEVLESDLETGTFTFRMAGVYDALAKETIVKTRELIDFAGADGRARRGSALQ